MDGRAGGGVDKDIRALCHEEKIALEAFVRAVEKRSTALKWKNTTDDKHLCASVHIQCCKNVN